MIIEFIGIDMIWATFPSISYLYKIFSRIFFTLKEGEENFIKHFKETLTRKWRNESAIYENPAFSKGTDDWIRPINRGRLWCDWEKRREIEARDSVCIDAGTAVTKGLRHPRSLSAVPREILLCICLCVCVRVHRVRRCARTPVLESTLYNYIRGRNLPCSTRQLAHC